MFMHAVGFRTYEPIMRLSADVWDIKPLYIVDLPLYIVSVEKIALSNTYIGPLL